jgi:undecaprenyl-diphosphatase
MPEWIQEIDDQLFHWLQQHHSAGLSYNLEQVVTLGSSTLVALLAVFVCGLLLLDRQFIRAVLVLVIPVGAYFAAEGIKVAVARPRPLVERSPGQPPKALSSTPSFPSGHATISMMGLLLTAFGLQDFWRRAGRRGMYAYAVLWAVGVAALVGVSRLYFGFHYLSDVVGGWLLGAAFALLYLALGRLLSRKRGEPAAA